MAVTCKKAAGGCALRFGTARSTAVKSIAYLPGHQALCCGCSDRTLRAYSSATCEIAATVTDVHMDAISLLAAAPHTGSSSALVASADATGVVALHTLGAAAATTEDADATSSKLAAALLGTLAVPDGRAPTGLVLASTGGLLVATEGGTVAHWDCEAATTALAALTGMAAAAGPAPTWTCKPHSACHGLAQAGAHAVAAIGAAPRVVLVDCRTGKAAQRWKVGASAGAKALALTCVDGAADGSLIAVGTATGSVLLYDVRSTAAPLASIVVGRTSVAAVRIGDARALKAAATARTQPEALRNKAEAPLSPIVPKHTTHDDCVPSPSPQKLTEARTCDDGYGEDEEAVPAPAAKYQRLCVSQRLPTERTGTAASLVQSARSAMAAGASAQAAAQQPALAETSHGHTADDVARAIERAKTEVLALVHRDLLNLHADVVRGFQALREDMEAVLRERLQEAQETAKENERLKEELRKLKHLC